MAETPVNVGLLSFVDILLYVRWAIYPLSWGWVFLPWVILAATGLGILVAVTIKVIMEG